jgi:hypothetical protein
MNNKFSTTRRSEKPIKEIFPNALGIINYAFTLNDTDYYEWADINSIPCERGFQALSFYNELSMRCTRDFLKAHCQAVQDVINDNTGIKITKLAKLNMVMEERLQLLHEPEIAAKLLSVVFFDETENPHRFDYGHSARKAKIFLNVQLDAEMFDFFLSQPIVKWIPYLSSFTADFPQYCQTMIAITEEHLKNISTMLSEVNKNSESFSWLMSQMQEDSPLMKLKT